MSTPTKTKNQKKSLKAEKVQKTKKSPKTEKSTKSKTVAAEKRDRNGTSDGARKTVPRMIRIAGLIRQGICPPITHLARIFEICERTIERDFDYLRGYSGMEFEYDRVRKVHYATKEMIALPGQQLSAPEIMALLMGGRSMQTHLGAGLFELAFGAIKKITTFMTAAQADEWKRLDSLFTYCGLPSAEQLAPDIFPTLAQALLDSEELEIFYLKRDADTPEWRRVRPLHLFFRSNRWYLWAQDHARDLTGRRFVLTEIHELRRTGVKFTRPTDFNPQEVLAHTVGLYGGGEPEPLRIRMDKRAARWLKRDPFHPKQQITLQPDGSYELTAHMSITPELEGLIERWGLLMEVLEPRRIHEAILDRAKGIVARG